MFCEEVSYSHGNYSSFVFLITVIDFCLARHMVCDKDTNYQSLRLTWVFY